MGRPPAKPPALLDRGLLPSLLGYVLRRAQSAVFDDFANTFAKAGEALTPGEFGLLVEIREQRPRPARPVNIVADVAVEVAIWAFRPAEWPVDIDGERVRLAIIADR